VAWTAWPSPFTPVTISGTALPTATPTPLTVRPLALALAQSLTLDQKLGQMVISEFSGATLTQGRYPDDIRTTASRASNRKQEQQRSISRQFIA